MYFKLFKPQDWRKRSGEARRRNCAGLPHQKKQRHRRCSVWQKDIKNIHPSRFCVRQSAAYSPFCCSSCVCEPRSAMRPSAMTTISPAARMVDRRCAMMSVVRFFASSSNACWIFDSVSVSSALVASSRMRMGGFLRKIRAMAMRCFCPPESSVPRSPT